MVVPAGWQFQSRFKIQLVTPKPVQKSGNFRKILGNPGKIWEILGNPGKSQEILGKSGTLSSLEFQPDLSQTPPGLDFHRFWYLLLDFFILFCIFSIVLIYLFSVVCVATGIIFFANV